MNTTPLERWRDALAAWAIPDRILREAQASPWLPEPRVFIRRAASRKARPQGRSYERAREALPVRGTVIDVGAGAGAASLPLLDIAGSLIAVDTDAALLTELRAQAETHADKVRTVVGRWPDAAAKLPVADVVVCHHVLYNTADLQPFVAALDAHAHRRVVIEITEHHPLTRLNPLWKRFHDLDRPTTPTWVDAEAALRSFHADLRVEHDHVPSDVSTGTWGELVGATCRRLCLPAERRDDVAAALVDDGAQPDDPSTWSPRDRGVVTLWWDGAYADE